MPSPTVVFDLDGTLIRLLVDIESARREISEGFARRGIHREFRPILHSIRQGAGEIAALGGDGESAAREALDILDRYELCCPMTASPQLIRVVTALHHKEIPLAIVTDNGRCCVAPRLREAGIDPQWFRSIVTRDDVPDPKPSPFGLLKALDMIRPEGPVWYIGDTVKDIQAARAAAESHPSLKVAAVLGGMGTASALDAARPDRLLVDLSEVLTLPGLLD